MEPVIIACVVSIAVALLGWTAYNRLAGTRADVRTRSILNRMTAGEGGYSTRTITEMNEDLAAAERKPEVTGIGSAVVMFPGGERFYYSALKAGRGLQMNIVVLATLLLMIALSVILTLAVGPLGIILAIAIGWYLPVRFFEWEVQRRNDKFIDMFPEAIDMIVRSVKSGHPLNAAMRLIADNMESPVREEFRQVVNEVSYGRPLVEALRRMSQRIDEPDVHFFVVVLSVQQESGGNLAEILGNLSNVIRNRKKLRQKIKALTSEGRATAWVLGLLPFLQFGAIYLTSPEYLVPLWTTVPGAIILAVAFFLVALAAFIVKNMIDVDI